MQPVCSTYCQSCHSNVILGTAVSPWAAFPVMTGSSALRGCHSWWWEQLLSSFHGILEMKRLTGGSAPKQQSWLLKRTIGESLSEPRRVQIAPGDEKESRRKGLEEQGGSEEDQRWQQFLYQPFYCTSRILGVQNNFISPSKSFSVCSETKLLSHLGEVSYRFHCLFSHFIIITFYKKSHVSCISSSE